MISILVVKAMFIDLFVRHRDCGVRCLPSVCGCVVGLCLGGYLVVAVYSVNFVGSY